jgi:D-alanine-D-alanine ligase-like ATP-grasp enzyme
LRPPLERLVIAYETEAACHRRLLARGFAPDAASEIALYLAQAQDLETMADELRAAFAALGTEVHFLALDEAHRLPLLVGPDPARSIVWNPTDGFAYYRGSFASSAARLLGAATFGSGPQAQHLCQDKQKCLALARSVGVRVPPSALAEGGRFLTDPAELPSAGPFFVKPNTLGAKIGIAADACCPDLEAALALSRRIGERYRDRALIQPYLSGFDVRVSFMATHPEDATCRRLGLFRVDVSRGGEAGSAFPTLEDSLTLSRLRDPGAEAAGVDARLTDLEADGTAGPLGDEIRRMVERMALLMDLRDYFSFDVRVDAAGRPWFLELEVCPAVTIYDFRRYLQAKHGLDLPEALARAVPLAHARSC